MSVYLTREEIKGLSLGEIDQAFYDRLVADAETSSGNLASAKAFNGLALPASYPINWWQRGMGRPQLGETATVHACTDAYGQTVASLRCYHYSTDEADVKSRIMTSAAARTILRPNSYQTRSDFYYNLVKSMLHNGNAYVYGVRNSRNEIVEMHLLNPRGTQPYVDSETQEVFYAAGENPLLGDIQFMIPQRDIMHVRLYCPRHPLVGVTPLAHAAMSIAANASITSSQATFFENMSRPSGVLSTDLKLTSDQMKQLRTAWEEQSKDINAGGIPILGSGMKWQPMSITSQDAQLVDAFHMTVEDISRAFRVPLPLINDSRHSTYNNVEQLVSTWLSGGLGFLIDHLENAMDRFFGLDLQRQKIEFNTDALLRTDFETRVEGYTKSIQNALMTPNEARARMGGLPAVEYGDQPIVQQQMVPLGWMNEQEQAEEAPVEDMDDEPELTDDETERDMNVIYLQRALREA